MSPERVRSDRIRRVVFGSLAVISLGLLVVVGRDAWRTLGSVKKIDDYPHYTMEYSGGYAVLELLETVAARSRARRGTSSPGVAAPGACSSFAVLGSGGEPIFGHNDDNSYRPVMLLFARPPGRYASVSTISTVDLVGMSGLESVPFLRRLRLLFSPFVMSDGMNEHGLVVSRNGVPATRAPMDPRKPTTQYRLLMRLVLDRARTVEEAIALIRSRNVGPEGTVDIHFHVADASGNSAIIEYVDGEIVVVPKTGACQVSTNHLVSSPPPYSGGSVYRRKVLREALERARESLTLDGAMSVLAGAADAHVWSIVYSARTGEIRVAVGDERRTGDSHRLELGMAARR